MTLRWGGSFHRILLIVFGDACIAETYIAVVGAVAVVGGMIAIANSPIADPIVIPQEPTVEPGPNITITPMQPQSLTVTQRTFQDNTPTVIANPMVTPEITVSQQPMVQNGETVQSSWIPGTPLTEQAIREAMQGAPLHAQQSGVSLPVVQRYAERLANGEITPPSIKDDGNVLVDGYHRYIASRLVGIQLAYPLAQFLQMVPGQ
ncbi:hypothetical protein [Paenibacillus agricola]|uniref:ParB/Sulfiredoxin domain-containing protein n=1 Tax=Paenibacillus agricola TaxID=2716264 RepID=A0ABX0JIN7_9BACL|nr:hypothetical protein [Paenibacillus agricola]NHN35239.1 hypothetical protein [Paenibacillus agricola]